MYYTQGSRLNNQSIQKLLLWLCNSVLLSYSAALKRSLVALGINGKLISSICYWTCKMRTRSLCYCLNAHVGLCVRVCVCVCLLHKATHKQESLIDSQRILREAITGANKCTHVESELHVLTRLCQQLRSERWLPLGSLNINEQSHWKQTKIFMFKSISVLVYFTPSSTFFFSNKSVSLETSVYCLQTQRKCTDYYFLTSCLCVF